jgi:hypothetical protein
MKQPTKKSLAEAMQERLKFISDARREKDAAERREKFKDQEDEVMVMTHGPDWRKKLAGEPVREEETPEPPESDVQLKAS